MPAFLNERRLSLGAIGAAAIVGAAIPIVLGRFSLYVVLEAAMVVLALLPGATAIFLGRLNVTRHVPFWILYAAVLTYIYLAPAAYVARGMVDRNALAPIYLALQVLILVFFLVPLFALYIRWTARGGESGPARWSISQRALFVFVPVCLGLPAWYVALLVKHGLLFRRVGFTSIANNLVGLPRVDFLVIRGFEALAVPLLCLLVLAVRDAKGWPRLLLGLSLLSLGSVTLLDAALNSRYQWILALALPLAVAVNLRPAVVRPWRYWVATVLVLISALYGARLVENIRSTYTPSGVSVSASTLSPTTTPSYSEPLSFRLNGLDLMARMTPAAVKQGYSWGKSWWPYMVVEVTQVVAPQIANKYKLGLATEPKWYLMRDYHVASLPDYPSSAFTDLYGNLGPFGFPIAAVVYALLLVLLTRWMRRGPVMLVIALFLLADVVYFEGSFVGLAFRWILYSPAVILLLLINPLRRGAPLERKPASAARQDPVTPDPTAASPSPAESRRGA
jgi:hypothetical protein